MKKMIINALGITSILIMLIMIVVKIGWTNKVGDNHLGVISNQANRIDKPEDKNKLVSMCDRVDRLSDNIRDIRSQNTVVHSNAYSSSNRHIFDESLFGDSNSHDPKDYPSEDSFHTNNNRKINHIDDYKEAKAAEVIE